MSQVKTNSTREWLEIIYQRSSESVEKSESLKRDRWRENISGIQRIRDKRRQRDENRSEVRRDGIQNAKDDHISESLEFFRANAGNFLQETAFPGIKLDDSHSTEHLRVAINWCFFRCFLC